ncbi:MAG: Thiopurine S-methyltransferase (EC [uncultured Sulfurovum sp.]|uniref:Thiopurine S-methyltransferase n=1 Tax=uncultured Sulfurovum sp. TaxID=269237 RepID=A0A6S6TXF3_9BACT|nr:MAG: Thiopurine S-methyltransferase (EC [uncultured Sulfurovum sp.]
MNENSLWLQRWENREIGFNQNQPNSFMVKHFDNLNLETGTRVLVPLCGKSIDISWLLAKGHKVTGVELSEQAVIELFDELTMSPNISKIDGLILYSTENLEVYVADIFEINSEMLGKIDAIYDRAALVALTTEVRVNYTAHLRDISNHAPQLLLCFEYDQSLMNRTPYSVEESEVRKHYGEHYTLKLLTREEIAGGFKGGLIASDAVWLLK